MFQKAAIVVAAIGLAAVNAAPAARATGFSSQCTDISFTSGWLIGNCSTGNGNERIVSSVYLPNKVGNLEASLAWVVDGAFQSSCSDCSVSSSAVLSCICDRTGNAVQNTTLNLEEHIANYNGHLLSDLSGTPQVPTTSSSVPIPSDLSWKLYYGNLSCYTTTSGACESLTYTPTTCSSMPTVVNSNGAPEDCYTFHLPVAANVYTAFKSLSISAPSKAFSVQVYDNLQCSGSPVGSLSSFDTCQAFSRTAVGIRVTPLWNAD